MTIRMTCTCEIKNGTTLNTCINLNRNLYQKQENSITMLMKWLIKYKQVLNENEINNMNSGQQHCNFLNVVSIKSIDIHLKCKQVQVSIEFELNQGVCTKIIFRTTTYYSSKLSRNLNLNC